MNMSETIEDRKCCCNFCKCVEDNTQISKHQALMDRMHKCKIVDILTERQYIDMCKRMINSKVRHTISVWKKKERKPHYDNDKCKKIYQQLNILILNTVTFPWK